MSENETIPLGSNPPEQARKVRRWRNGGAVASAGPKHSRLFPLMVGGLLGAIIGLLISTVPARIYEAATQVSLPAPAMGAKPNAGIDTLRQRVLSDDVLRRVIADNGLTADRDLAPRPADKPAADVADVIINLRRRISVQPVGEGRAEISMRTDKADKAARLADALAGAVVPARIVPNGPAMQTVPTVQVPHVPASPLQAPASTDASSVLASLNARLEAAIAARRAAEVALREATQRRTGPEVVNSTGTARERYEEAISEATAARIRNAQAQATLSAARRALVGELGDPETAPPELRSVAIQLSTFARIEAGLTANPAARNDIASLRRLLLADTQRAAQTAANEIAVTQELEARALAEIASLRSRVGNLVPQAKPEAVRMAEQNLATAQAVERALSEALNRSALVRPTPVRPAPNGVAMSPERPVMGLNGAVVAGNNALGTAPPAALAIISPAKIPSTPLHPPVLAIVLASVVAGLAFGAFFASRREA